MSKGLAGPPPYEPSNSFCGAPQPEKPALETNGQILAPLRYTVQQEQRRTRELQEQEAELVRAVDSEESRWSELNSRLEELERLLSR